MPPLNNLLELTTAEPVSTYTNPHGQIDALIAQSGAEQIALEDMMYGSIRNPVPRVEAPGLGLLEYADTGPLIGMKALKGVIKKPIQAIAPQSLIDLLFKKKLKVSPLKTKPSGSSSGLDRMFRRLRAEMQGKNILFNKFQDGMYPEDIVGKFFSEVYPEISIKNQKQFRQWSQTGEYYPGLWDPKAQKEIDVPFKKQVGEYIRETFPTRDRDAWSGFSHTSTYDEAYLDDALDDYLRGIGDSPDSRGTLSYMAIFNDAYDIWKASRGIGGKKAESLLDITKKLK
jgi:hypothetical protein